MGIFSDMDSLEDPKEGLYDPDEGIGQQDGEDSVFWDSELKGVFEVVSLRAWESDSEPNKGNRYFKAELRCKELWRHTMPKADVTQDQIEEAGVDSIDDLTEEELAEVFSDIRPGVIVTHMNELPKHDDPDKQDKSEQHSLAEAHGLGAALMGIYREYFTGTAFDKLCRDDGKKAKGRTVGAEIEASIQERDIRGNDITFVYYNPDWFPVKNGEQVDFRTPDELRAETE